MYFLTSVVYFYFCVAVIFSANIKLLIVIMTLHFKLILKAETFIRDPRIPRTCTKHDCNFVFLVYHIYNCFALDKTLPVLILSLLIQIKMVSLFHVLFLLLFFTIIDFTLCCKDLKRLFSSYFFVSRDWYALKY